MPRKNTDSNQETEAAREQPDDRRTEVRHDSEQVIEPIEDHEANRERGGRYGDGWW